MHATCIMPVKRISFNTNLNSNLVSKRLSPKVDTVSEKTGKNSPARQIKKETYKKKKATIKMKFANGHCIISLVNSINNNIILPLLKYILHESEYIGCTCFLLWLFSTVLLPACSEWNLSQTKGNKKKTEKRIHIAINGICPSSISQCLINFIRNINKKKGAMNTKEKQSHKYVFDIINKKKQNRIQDYCKRLWRSTEFSYRREFEVSDYHLFFLFFFIMSLELASFVLSIRLRYSAIKLKYENKKYVWQKEKSINNDKNKIWYFATARFAFLFFFFFKQMRSHFNLAKSYVDVHFFSLSCLQKKHRTFDNFEWRYQLSHVLNLFRNKI